jgi:hypothetical protein
MNLSEVYEKNVSKKRILPFCGSSSSSNLPLIQRDPTILNLENAVFSKLKEISKPEEDIPKKPIFNKPSVVSFEQALKELANFK